MQSIRRGVRASRACVARPSNWAGSSAPAAGCRGRRSTPGRRASAERHAGSGPHGCEFDRLRRCRHHDEGGVARRRGAEGEHRPIRANLGMCDGSSASRNRFPTVVHVAVANGRASYHARARPQGRRHRDRARRPGRAPGRGLSRESRNTTQRARRNDRPGGRRPSRCGRHWAMIPADRHPGGIGASCRCRSCRWEQVPGPRGADVRAEHGVRGAGQVLDSQRGEFAGTSRSSNSRANGSETSIDSGPS